MNQDLLVAAMLTAALGTSDYSVLGGTVGFTEPDAWDEVARTDTDSGSVVAFVVPRPSRDPGAPAGNVIVDIALSYAHRDLKTYSELKVAQVSGGPGSPVLVDSRYWPDGTRTVLWSSRLKGTPYALWDKIAVRDSIYIDVRTAIPVVYARDSSWQAEYQLQLDSLLNSICIGTQPVFATSSARCPDVEHVLPFTRAENEDGAWFVWLIERRDGYPRRYLPANQIPRSTYYTQVEADSARDGDVVWWPTFVAFFEAGTSSILLVEGLHPLRSYVARLGQPKFYRRLVPK
jgi:hypothetical protein